MENAQKLIAALTEFGFSSGELSTEMFTRKNSRVVMGVEPMAVDILNYLVGGDFNGAYARRKTIKAEDIEVHFLSYKDLIANKKAVGRLKDLVDIEELQKRNK